MSLLEVGVILGCRFFHDITNLGILFVTDRVAGAREIYHALRSTGVAAVISWSASGYLKNVIRPAQKGVRPDNRLKDGGFEKVSVSEATVHYGATSMDNLSKLLLDWFETIWKGWSEEDQERFRTPHVVKWRQRHDSTL
ncbi:hypothetical protein HZ326_13045 [Fusarium oxysporum f. sp. albedinis]|nr:hypothetical protein HZ326_13045 [Fusarium oxysporum f. sp. albedinis]